MADELTAAEKRAQRQAAKKEKDAESLSEWRKERDKNERINDMNRGRILYNPGPMYVDSVTSLSNGNESVLVHSAVTGVSESVLFRPGKPKKGESPASMTNYMKHVGADDAGNDIYEPTGRQVQKLIEVRPYTYGDNSKKAGQTVMSPVFSDVQKAAVDKMPASTPEKNGAIVSGFLRLISEDENGAKLTIGMRDQNGNVPTYGGSVFFDVPKDVEKDNFKIRAMLNELRGVNNADGEKPKGIYANVVCMMDATAIERPQPTQRANESQEDFAKRTQRWQQSHDNRVKYGIQSRENFAITDVKDMSAMTHNIQDRIMDAENARAKAAAKAAAAPRQEGPKS